MITRRHLLAAGIVLGGGVLSQEALAQAADPTIALVQINQQALFFNQMNEGATAAAENAGAKLVDSGPARMAALTYPWRPTVNPTNS